VEPLETTDGDDSASWRIIAVSVFSLSGLLQTTILPRGSEFLLRIPTAEFFAAEIRGLPGPGTAGTTKAIWRPNHAMSSRINLAFDHPLIPADCEFPGFGCVFG